MTATTGLSQRLRVGIVCDMREEGWHSMDLIADMLLELLPAVAGEDIEATRLCAPMRSRWSRLPLVGKTQRARLGDRLTGRLWDYPRWLAPRVSDFDVFHIVDHSYAYLARVLPAGRTIVTCNDVDAIQAALPGSKTRFAPAGVLAAKVLDGLGRVAHIACISDATKRDLLATGRIDPSTVSVAYLGVHPSCSADRHPKWDEEIDRRLGPRGATEILHVGSTIPRKGIDVLLNVVSRLRTKGETVRLVRVGGLLTPDQRTLAGQLGMGDDIVELPFLERPVLAALYRRASVVVLPSKREGFGLPVVEAMACGTPVVTSDLPALREAGGDAAIYCPSGDVERWANALSQLLAERRADSPSWHARRRASINAASRFDWRTYAIAMSARYRQIVPVPVC